ncbi:MAG: hypothetical protein JHD16_00570 [Solirubrobacteraceae bacterium]|nr:hypothetical protein [Solirubrobacteraceae bacterium]
MSRATPAPSRAFQPSVTALGVALLLSSLLAAAGFVTGVWQGLAATINSDGNSFQAAQTQTPVSGSPPIILDANYAPLAAAPTVDDLLRSQPGEWAGTGLEFTYEWLRCDTAAQNCQPIAGADSSTYTVQGDDQGHRLRLRVTATNSAGSQTATSSPTGTIAITWRSAGSMNVARSEFGYARLPDGKVLVAGGATSTGWTGQSELYDPATGAWTPTGAMQTPRIDPGADFQLPVLPDGRVVYAGGYPSVAATTSVEIFNPQTGAWSTAAPMSQGRSGYAWSILPDGRLLVAGGSLNAGGTAATASVEIYDPQSNTWAAGPSMATARYNGAFVTLRDGRLMVISGWTSTAAPTNAEIYNPQTNTWATVSTPFGRYAPVAQLLPDGRVIVAGGGSPSTAHAEAWLYNPQTNAWASTGAMPSPRAWASIASRGDGGPLVVSGNDASGMLTSVVRYDHTQGTWAAQPTLQSPHRIGLAIALSDGRTLDAGGYTTASARTATAETLAGPLGADPINLTAPAVAGTAAVGQALRVTGGSWEGRERFTYQWLRCTASTCTPISGATWGRYTVAAADAGRTLRARVTAHNAYGSTTIDTDPTGTVAAQWAATGALSTARSQSGVIKLPDGKVLLAGGYGNSGPIASSESYNPATGQWSAAGALNTARSMAWLSPELPKLPNGRWLIAGGLTTGDVTTATTETYDADTGQWSAAPSMASPRVGMNPVSLPDGRVLVAGGYSNYSTSTTTATAEVFDADTNSWSNVASMTQKRGGHTTTVLNDGRVLVAGGDEGSGTILTTAEIYDPQTNQWSTTTMPGAMFAASAVTLADGRVLIVAGGQSASWLPGSTAAYLFNPANDTWSTAGSMSAPRVLAHAWPLADGRVLVTGALSGSQRATAETYNPQTNTWSAYDTMLSERAVGSAVTLSDGDLMAAGGIGASARTTAAELHGQTVTAPENTTAPEIVYPDHSSGRVAVSQGAWSGAPTQFTYEWERCDTNGANCVTIAGADRSYKTITGADYGHTLRAKVTATNSAGQSTATTSTSSLVGSYRQKVANQAGAYWRMDETTGTTIEDSVGDYDGTQSGATLGQAGIIKFSSAFGGNPAHVSLPSVPITPSSSFTLEARVRPTSLPAANQGAYLLFRGNGHTTSFEGFGLAIYDGKYELVMSNPDTIGQRYIIGGTAAAGQWAHVTATFDRATGRMRLYVDGKRVAQGTFASDMKLASTPTYMGRSGYNVGTGEGWFNGRLDEVSVTTRALSAGEVADRHRADTTAGPVNAEPPTITGEPKVGRTLTAAPGAWAGTDPPVTYAYQWQRPGEVCAGGGQCWTDISGATSATYDVSAHEIGNQLRVRVTATDSQGATTGHSAATTAVAVDLAALRSEVAADNPWASWRHDDQPTGAACGFSTAACAPDSSGNGRNGAVWSAAAGQLGIAPASNALRNPRYYRASVPSTGTARTVELWVRPDSVTAGAPQGLVSIGDQSGGYGLAMVNNTLSGNGSCLWLVHYHVGDGYDPASCGSIRAGRWQHVVVTFDRTHTKFYVNGVKVGQTADPAPAAIDPIVTVGYFADNHADPVGSAAIGFTGSIDEVAVYEQALSAERIAAHYAAGA